MGVSRRLAWLVAVVALVGIALSGVSQEVADFREVSYETSDGGMIFANLYGEGAHAVLLAHGAVFDKESWDPFARRLVAEGYQVLAIDFRGYGKSTAGRSRGALHEDILGGVDYLHEQGAERVSVIGASMGGGAAGDAAARADEGAIDRLILLAAMPARSPRRMQGAKLFIVAGGDSVRSTVERQFRAARDPKELIVLPGSAHAQHIFRTGDAEALTGALLEWLAD